MRPPTLTLVEREIYRFTIFQTSGAPVAREERGMRKCTIAMLSVLVATACENEPIKHRQKHVEAPPAAAGVEVDSAKLSLYSALPVSAAGKDNPLTEEKIAL